MSAPRPNAADELAADLAHRLALRGVWLRPLPDGRVNIIAGDDGRLRQADVAEVRRHKRALLRLLETADLFDVAALAGVRRDEAGER